MTNSIRYGDSEVPVVHRDWPSFDALPYRKTYRLNPGDRWRDAPTTDMQFEHYVQLDREVMPVGAAIARDLIAGEARWACFTEQWGGRVVLVGPDLVCLPLEGPPAELLAQLRSANGGRLGGLPDVIGEGKDGKVLLWEAKTPASHDRLRSNQHAFARSAQRLLGARLDLAVVSWGPSPVVSGGTSG